MTPGTESRADDGAEPLPADELPVSELVALCLEHVSRGEQDVVDAMCEAHPDRARELRRRMERLAALGLVGDTPAAGPQSLGPFRVVGVLGEGGMGRVYLGQQSDPVRRLAAVKVSQAGGDTERMLRRFEAERQALAVLNHPGIAGVLQAGTTPEGAPWFAMEYVDGEPITLTCEKQGLDTEQRLDLFLQVCDAVTHAHQNGILHRDLKPGNVLVTEVSGAPVAKVIDFGLAKALESGDEAVLLTRSGQILGTPGYMSPEQAGVLGRAVDLRTDVYALGALLYQLLTEQLPLEPESLEAPVMLEMQRLLLDVEPVLPSARLAAAAERASGRRREELRRRARAVAGDLDWIVARALAKDPDDRYAAVSELAEDIRRHRRLEPVLAGPPSRLYRMGRLLRRYRRQVAAGVLGLVGLIVSLVVISLQASRLADELDGFDALAREMEVVELARRAQEDLWPERQEKLAAIEGWRADAQRILAERPRFQRALASVRERGSVGPGGTTYAHERDAYLEEHLVRLLAALDGLDGPDGLLAEVDARAAWARDLADATVTRHRAAWDAAIASIADEQECPAYRGLQLAPQPGLVPLGRNPSTALWEFAFPRPGAELPEGEPGAWIVTDDTCMVFVLVPPGAVQLSAQEVDPLAPDYITQLSRQERCGPHVLLDAFFLSKYEMTQAQYARFTGEDPAQYGPAHRLVDGLVHPVEQISWSDADRVLRRLGLLLPTGAQWEYAARAGNPSPWWTGPSDVAPDGSANLADASCLADAGRAAGIDDFDEDYDDSFEIHAPVDALSANLFGLHHVIGNVWEWCRDQGLDYHKSTRRAGDGLAVPPPGVADDRRRELRGGSFYSTFHKSRSTFRLYQPMDSVNQVFGIRPAREIEDAPSGELRR